MIQTHVGPCSLGIDVGSSSVKVALLDGTSGEVVGTATSPEREMSITAVQPGWAEQDPEVWWRHIVLACQFLQRDFPIHMKQVVSIGLSYQEHGLVLVGKDGRVLRNAIIWCDGRAVDQGRELFEQIGNTRCFERLANSPGNFTASRIAWVNQFEPTHIEKAYRVLLPGDYIAYRMTGEARTTKPGLSEGMLYDYSTNSLASFVLDSIGVDSALIPPLVETFGIQGRVTPSVAEELGVSPKTVVAFRAGDQHSNSFGLKVLSARQAAVTAGTSGVVYAVSDKLPVDQSQKVNTFLHVNHKDDAPRYSVVMCVNGAAISYRWIRDILGSIGDVDYRGLNAVVSKAAQNMNMDGSGNGIMFFPYGNGPERTLGNTGGGAALVGLDYNRHTLADVLWAILSGVTFAMRYGFDVLANIGLPVDDVKAGNANLFLNNDFAQVFATTMGTPIELYNSDPAIGAARGAALGVGIYNSIDEALTCVRSERVMEPDTATREQWTTSYQTWKTAMQRHYMQ